MLLKYFLIVHEAAGSSAMPTVETARQTGISQVTRATTTSLTSGMWQSPHSERSPLCGLTSRTSASMFKPWAGKWMAIKSNSLFSVYVIQTTLFVVQRSCSMFRATG